MITPRLAWRANRAKMGPGGCTENEGDRAPRDPPWHRDEEGHGMVVELLGGAEGKSRGAEAR